MIQIEAIRGDTLERVFQWRNDGASVKLLGVTAICQMKTSIDGDLIASISTNPDDGIIIDEEMGDVYVRFSAELMRAIFPGKYFADVELTYPDGTVQSTQPFVIRVWGDCSSNV